MKTMIATVTGIFSILLLLSGCGPEKKMEPVAVGEMESYKDPGYGFQISRPKGWIANAQVGRAAFYNAPDVDKKFLDPLGVGAIGVEISVTVTKTPEPIEMIKKYREDRLAENFALQPDQAITVSGKPATKMGYSASYDKNTVVNGHHVFIAGDSVLYDLNFSGFKDYYNAYNAVFEASLNSFALPKPVEKGRDETLPSDAFSDYDGKMFSFQYPENFNFTNPPKGKDDIVVGLRGVRLDCNILFNVFGAQGLTLDKVVEQNKGKYKGAASGKATVGGEPAVTLTLSASKDVDRRVYFTIKNDKVVRITMDWYKPQRTEYLAAYDKVISSIKFK